MSEEKIERYLKYIFVHLDREHYPIRHPRGDFRNALRMIYLMRATTEARIKKEVEQGVSHAAR